MKFIPKTNDLLNKMYSWSLDPVIRKCLGFPSIPMDLVNCRNYFDVKYDGISNALIGVVGDSGLIHGCYMIECDEKNRRARVDFVFDEVGRGKLLRESVIKFYDYMFDERGFLSLYGEISVANQQSYACALKMGWETVCILPDYLNDDGKMTDAYLIRLTKENRRV